MSCGLFEIWKHRMWFKNTRLVDLIFFSGLPFYHDFKIVIILSNTALYRINLDENSLQWKYTALLHQRCCCAKFGICLEHAECRYCKSGIPPSTVLDSRLGFRQTIFNMFNFNGIISCSERVIMLVKNQALAGWTKSIYTIWKHKAIKLS